MKVWIIGVGGMMGLYFVEMLLVVGYDVYVIYCRLIIDLLDL